MTLQGTAVAALALIAGFGGAWFSGRSSGFDKGYAEATAHLDAARDAAQQQAMRARAEGTAQAQKFEDERNELEKRHARALATARRALNAPVSCPATGRVGDIVIPADVVGSMFNRSESDGAVPSGASATEPDSALP